MENSGTNIVCGYARVSSRDQNLDRQIKQLTPLVSDVRYLFVDKATGANFDREEYQKMKLVLRPGDTLIICSLDRLGRNYSLINKEWADLHEKGIHLKVLDMPILDTREGDDAINDLISNLVFQILAYVSETERDKIKTRQAQGIAAARQKGTAFGRPYKELPDGWESVIEQFSKKELTATAAARALGISRSTFYRLIERIKE